MNVYTTRIKLNSSYDFKIAHNNRMQSDKIAALTILPLMRSVMTHND